MPGPEFVGYVGIPDFHDGTVLPVSVDQKTAEVVVRGHSGHQHVVRFEGVEAVENEPAGGHVAVLSL